MFGSMLGSTYFGKLPCLKARLSKRVRKTGIGDSDLPPCSFNTLRSFSSLKW